MADHNRDYDVTFYEDSSKRKQVASMHYSIPAWEEATIEQILAAEIENDPSIGKLHIVIAPV